MIPVASGLSVRPTAASRFASTQSLDHPMDSCPASTAAAKHVSAPMPTASGAPAATASSTQIDVVARHGPGWLARTNACTRVTIEVDMTDRDHVTLVVMATT